MMFWDIIKTNPILTIETVKHKTAELGHRGPRNHSDIKTQYQYLQWHWLCFGILLKMTALVIFQDISRKFVSQQDFFLPISEVMYFRRYATIYGPTWRHNPPDNNNNNNFQPLSHMHAVSVTQNVVHDVILPIANPVSSQYWLMWANCFLFRLQVRWVKAFECRVV